LGLFLFLINIEFLATISRRTCSASLRNHGCETMVCVYHVVICLIGILRKCHDFLYILEIYTDSCCYLRKKKFFEARGTAESTIFQDMTQN